jgi:branched-chain amino acid transport system substrate-binding protein
MPKVMSSAMKKILTALALLAASPASAEIAIGVAGPMSGNLSVFGAEMVAGAQQAVDDINASGGLLGEQLVLDAVDDRCDRKQAESVANQMIGREIKLMVGHLCSGASIVAAPVYHQAGIIQISPGAREGKYTDRRPGPGIFRLTGRDDRQGPLAGAFLAGKYPNAKIAIVHDGSPYGAGLAETTRRALNEAGKSEEVFEAYKPEQADLTPLITRLAAEGIDALFFAGDHREAGLIVRRMRDAGMQTQLVSGDALMTDEFLSVAGSAGVGALMLYPPEPMKSPAAADTIAALAAKGIVAEGYVLPSYAAVQVWAASVRSAGSFDYAAVAAAVSAGKFDTVLGTIGFDDKGDVDLPSYVIYEWRSDRYDYAPM